MYIYFRDWQKLFRVNPKGHTDKGWQWERGWKKDSLEGESYIYMDELRGECQSEGEQFESEHGEKQAE
jgi:hypothetical protein